MITGEPVLHAPHWVRARCESSQRSQNIELLQKLSGQFQRTVHELGTNLISLSKNPAFQLWLVSEQARRELGFSSASEQVGTRRGKLGTVEKHMLAGFQRRRARVAGRISTGLDDVLTEQCFLEVSAIES